MTFGCTGLKPGENESRHRRIKKSPWGEHGLSEREVYFGNRLQGSGMKPLN